MAGKRHPSLVTIVCLLLASCTTPAVQLPQWQSISGQTIDDDDLQRIPVNSPEMHGLIVEQMRFSENGFDWQLLRLRNPEKLKGPLWFVPHDDEDSGYNAMVEGLRRYGGVGIAINTSPAGKRLQTGDGICGIRSEPRKACDPNRNFAASSPKYTEAVLSQHQTGQPVIALHSNTPGFRGDGVGGRGPITMLDAAKYQEGIVATRADGHAGNGSVGILDSPDALGLLPYSKAKGRPSRRDFACQVALNAAGVNVWFEAVQQSDGSLSNFLTLHHPDIRYFNGEAAESNGPAAADMQHQLMIDAYMANCR